MTIPEAITTLNLTGEITKAGIKKQFRQSAHTHHPDKSGSATEFKKIKDAYDLLIKTPIEDIRSHSKTITSQRSAPGLYDPFIDLEYDHRPFFHPENANIEGYERKLRAKGCPHCDGFGFITKNTQPDKGFLGLETRLCKCQWL